MTVLGRKRRKSKTAVPAPETAPDAAAAASVGPDAGAGATGAAEAAAGATSRAAAFAAAAAIGPGSRIGRYTIERQLGQGGMGAVYLAHDPVIGRKVAVKVIALRPDMSDEESYQYQERFLREAQAAGALEHPNIVSVYDVGQDAATRRPYIVMEYVEGEDLKQVIRARAPMPPEGAARIAAQIASALDFAHRRGIVHRDIKPANVLLGARGQVKITDFGVARLPDSDLTRSDQFVGSPGFMSPEQLRGGTVDGRSDLFALGVILYELLTGKAPFQGESVSEVLYRISTQPADPPSEAYSDVSPDFDPILERALAKDPASRFQSGQEMVEALAAFVQMSAPEPEPAAGPAGSKAADEAAAAFAAPAGPASPWWTLNSQWRLGAMVGALILCLIAVNWAYVRLFRGPLRRFSDVPQMTAADERAEQGAAVPLAAIGAAPIGLGAPPAGARSKTAIAKPIAAVCATTEADPVEFAKNLASARQFRIQEEVAAAARLPSSRLRIDVRHEMAAGRLVVLVDGKTVLSKPFAAVKGKPRTLSHTLSLPAGRHGVEVRLLGARGAPPASSKIKGTFEKDSTEVLEAEQSAGGRKPLRLRWAS
jgi:predicted Ser/Thr protein kinase